LFETLKVTGKASLQADVQYIKNQEKPVVCRERADTETYVGGSKPLNHLQMIDFWPVSHQTLHGFHGRRNPTWRQANTRIVDYYYVWKPGRSLTCSGQLHIMYVEPVPTGQKHVAGSSYLCASTDHCWPVGLGEIRHLPANHGHNSCDMDTQIYAVDAQRHCPQDTTSSMLTLSRGAERHPSFVGGRTDFFFKFS